MEREHSGSVGQASNSPFDAILVHGYWLSEPKKDDVRLSLRNRLAARAGALEWDNGRGAKKVCVDLGNLWGPNYPTVGKLMAEELQANGVSEEAIVMGENAYSTGGEVKSFVEQVKENNWKRVKDVAFLTHQLTIPDVYKEYKTDAQVVYKSVEEIIAEKDDPHVVRLVKRLNSWKSRYKWIYKAYERAKWLRMRMPGFSYDKLEEKNKSTHLGKGKEFPLSFDVYKL